MPWIINTMDIATNDRPWVRLAKAEVRDTLYLMAHYSKPTPERTYVSKTRNCLKRREPFESDWAGERICRRCKGTHGWREGVASTPDYAVHRRR